MYSRPGTQVFLFVCCCRCCYYYEQKFYVCIFILYKQLSYLSGISLKVCGCFLWFVVVELLLEYLSIVVYLVASSVTFSYTIILTYIYRVVIKVYLGSNFIRLIGGYFFFLCIFVGEFISRLCFLLLLLLFVYHSAISG